MRHTFPAECGHKTGTGVSWRERVSIRSFYAILAVMAFCCHGVASESGGASLLPPQGTPVLEVHGSISNANEQGVAIFDMAMLRALPSVRVETTTAVTDRVRSFDGFLMRDLLALVGATGSTIIASALNDYTIEFPADEFHRYDVLVAYEMDGEPLLPSDKGPLWIIYPRDQNLELQDIRYDYRWVWQLRRLDIR